MKKVLSFILIVCLLCAAGGIGYLRCSSASPAVSSAPENSSTAPAASEAGSGTETAADTVPEPTAVPTPAPTAVPSAVFSPEPTSRVQTKEINFSTDGLPAELLEEVPEEYRGTLINYPYGQIYLPYGYDETQKYNVLFLLWGWAGDPLCWFSYDLYKTWSGKDIVDAIYYQGYAEPMLLVTFATPGYDYEPGRNSMYFTETVLPYIVENFPTYADGTDEESLKAARDHFGMAGFSNGSFYTVCSGFGTWDYGEYYSGTCLDYVSWFGLFAGFRDPEEAHYVETDPHGAHSINLALFCCGNNDENGNYDCLEQWYPLWLETEAFEEGVNTAKIVYDGFGHSFYMVLTSLYNTMQIIFTDYELTEGGAIIYTDS